VPGGNAALLALLKASAEFAAAGSHLAADRPLDAWREESLHFYVFPMRSSAMAPSNGRAASEAPVAVFVVDGRSGAVVSAVAVTPNGASLPPHTLDLRLASPALPD
jgi:hypothetical protein